MQPNADLPTKLLIAAVRFQMDNDGTPYYVIQKGADERGTILLNIVNKARECLILSETRDKDGKKAWFKPLGADLVAEKQADEYITRTMQNDPDLWVIEIDDDNFKNPFEGNIL